MGCPLFWATLYIQKKFWMCHKLSFHFSRTLFLYKTPMVFWKYCHTTYNNFFLIQVISSFISSFKQAGYVSHKARFLVGAPGAIWGILRGGGDVPPPPSRSYALAGGPPHCWSLEVKLRLESGKVTTCESRVASDMTMMDLMGEKTRWKVMRWNLPTYVDEEMLKLRCTRR